MNRTVCIKKPKLKKPRFFKKWVKKGLLKKNYIRYKKIVSIHMLSVYSKRLLVSFIAHIEKKNTIF